MYVETVFNFIAQEEEGRRDISLLRKLEKEQQNVYKTKWTTSEVKLEK